MNLQERLLQNEIKHLEQVIQTLSYEMVVFQEFMKHEYGSKFERFRSNYASSLEDDSEIIRPHQSSRKQYANSSRHGGYSSGKERHRAEPSTSTNIAEPIVEENATMDADLADDNNETSVKYDNDSESDYNKLMSDSDTSLKDPLDGPERKGGRKKTRIWKYFDIVTHKDNKVSARCHICHCLVSSRATRLVEHRIKCKRGKTRVGRFSESKKNFVKEAGTRMEQSGEPDPDEPWNELSDTEGKKTTQPGRNLDLIWDYYEITYQDDLKKAKCLSCGQYVSPKAVRLRHHKINCKGAGGTGTRTSGSDVESS